MFTRFLKIFLLTSPSHTSWESNGFKLKENVFNSFSFVVMQEFFMQGEHVPKFLNCLSKVWSRICSC